MLCPIAMGVVGLLRRSVERLMRHDGTGLAAELAYRAFFALAPFIVFLTALAALVAALLGIPDPGGRIVAILGATVPENVATILRDQLQATLGQPAPALLSIGLVGALWAATGGVNTLIKATNRAFEVVESRGFVKRYATALTLTVLAALLVLAGVTAIAAGAILGLGVLPLPLVIVLLFAASLALYRLGPNVSMPIGSLVPGAAVFAILWAAATYGFSLYVSRFGSYDKTYGTLGAVAVLLVWLYIASLALVSGAELNAAIAEQRMPRHVERERTRGRLPHRAA